MTVIRKLGVGFFTAAVLSNLSGCVPVFLTAAATTALVADDRRTTGTQVDDEGIENRVQFDSRGRYRTDIHLNVTSFNGIVLLSGEVASDRIKADIEKIARSVAKVRNVQNELVVGPVTSMGTRTGDSVTTSRIKTGFLGNQKFHPNHVKVVTEDGVAYLMGLVTRDEADAAVNVARNVSGVRRVVKLFEYIS